MRIRRTRALGYPKRIRYLSLKRIVAFRRYEAAVLVQKIARGVLVRCPLYYAIDFVVI